MLSVMCAAAIAAFVGTAPPGDLVSKGGPGMDVPGVRNSPSIRYASFTPADVVAFLKTLDDGYN